MSRLVEKVNLPLYGEMYVACAGDVSLETMQALQEPLKKLYDYEQEEEQGLFIHLPCKLGYVPYWISDEDADGNKGLFVREDEPITGITIREDGVYISTSKEVEVGSKIGSRWGLLTREDAERKLKEMEAENEKNNKQRGKTKDYFWKNKRRTKAVGQYIKKRM